jgi:tryptophan synthase alpha chain
LNRIDKAFRALKRKGASAFIAYITAGDPDLRTTARLVLELERSGVDIVELGVPFSDPIADGPTIQEASQRALLAGASVRGIFSAVGRLRKRTGIPIVFMTYYNPILRFGLEPFFAECRRSGVDGVIVPDLPHDEAAPLVRAARRRGVHTIFLAAPTSTGKRIRRIAAMSRGFIYYVSLTGVTGARRALASDLRSNLKRIKAVTGKPVAVGFGVSGAAQARAVAKVADGVIVGSAIVRLIGGRRGAVPRVGRFARTLARAIHGR